VRAGRADDALGAARTATTVGDSAVARKPADLDHRRAVGDAYLALGEVLAATRDETGARRARERALAVVDSVARASRQTELLALAANALVDLGRPADARALAPELARRGYRHPAYVGRIGDSGTAALR
jgi:tetratricopeptide (TPR) repeat protein